MGLRPRFALARYLGEREHANAAIVRPLDRYSRLESHSDFPGPVPGTPITKRIIAVIWDHADVRGGVCIGDDVPPAVLQAVRSSLKLCPMRSKLPFGIYRAKSASYPLAFSWAVA